MRHITVGLDAHLLSCAPECIRVHGSQYVLNTLSARKQSVTYAGFSSFSSPSNFNGTFVDNSTMLGQLSNGVLDWIIYRLVLTEQRAKYLEFSIPVYQNKLCFFTGKKWLKSVSTSQNNMFFLNAFPQQLWWLFISLMLLYVGTKLIIRRCLNNHETFSLIRRLSFGFASVCFVVFYSINLKLSYINTMTLTEPFNTVDQLIGLIKTRNYKFIINAFDDYRLEMVNSSQNPAIQRLKKALYPNNVVRVTSSNAMWNTLVENTSTFTLESWFAFLRIDHKAAQQGILGICPDELPGIYVGYGFPKRSYLVEKLNRRINFAFGLMKRHMDMLERSRTYHFTSDPNPKLKLKGSIRLNNTEVLITVYFVVLFCYMMIFGLLEIYHKLLLVLLQTANGN